MKKILFSYPDDVIFSCWFVAQYANTIIVVILPADFKEN